MKGLLIKDFKLMKAQNKFLILMAVLCIWFFIANREVAFVISYMAAMISVLVVATVNYDEYDNGMGFLFTYPISRRSYVLEKFVFGMLMMAGICIAGGILVFAKAALKHEVYDPAEGLTALLISIITVSLILSVTLPVQLKFGAEKSRIALVLGVAGAGIVVYGVQQAAKICAVDLSGVAERIRQASITEVAVCICVLSAAMLGISYWISVVIMKGKQF